MMITESFPFHDTRPFYHLSIDGSTATVGLCYFTVSDNKMYVEDCRLLDVTKHDDKYEQQLYRHQGLTVRLRRLRDGLFDFLGDHPIDSPIFYESHFINVRRPTSVVPLVRFSQIVYDVGYDRGISVETVAPQQMKRAIQVTGKLSKADKDKVYQAIKQLVLKGHIKLAEHLRLDDLSEHEIDAIGIGYTGMQLHYPTM